MGMHVGAQRHASCFDQVSHALQRIYHEIASQVIFLNFEPAN